MLQFPAWKVALIFAVMLWGTLMALPNVVNTQGIPFVPKESVNLGLDLQGGVYLMMELNPNEVIENRLEQFAGEVRPDLRTKRIGHLPEANGKSMTIRLTKPNDDGTYPMSEALDVLRKRNYAVEGALGGTKTYEFAQRGENEIIVTVPPASEEALMKDALGKTMTIVRRRVDPDGVSEISITPQGNSRIILEAPGEPDPQRLKDLLSRDGKMTFNMADLSESTLARCRAGSCPAGYTLRQSLDQGEMAVKNIPEITGEDIASANKGYDEGNRPQINFRLNGNGARKFYDTTRNNSGKFFAIVLDDVVMSAPRINEPIPGGQVRITGSFTEDEASDLAAIIEAGQMPAKVQFLDQRTVSATLGQDSINAGMRASLIGLALVAVFMVVAYGLLGGFAVASLGANILLIFGALSGLGATLTLPGIAGIILTIGMAVDANVLVFERIREEQREGRSPLTAVQAGYERALSTIMDANITTMIAALILYLLGSGPVKGFAVTLGIGIVTSVFTAFVLTRLFTVFWLKTFRPKKLAI